MSIFGLEAGQRVRALLGPNGAGKTTLVKTIVGELAPLCGGAHAHPDLRIGYFAAHGGIAARRSRADGPLTRDIDPDGVNQNFP